jgi:hypothetical protein
MSTKPVYPTLETSDSRILLWGKRAALEISMPFTGVIRFRHRPGSSETNEIHPIFERKDSPAISWSGEPIPLRIDYSNDEYAQAMSDPISVTVNRRDGSWSALTEDGNTIARLVEQGSKINFDHTGMIFETTVSLEAVHIAPSKPKITDWEKLKARRCLTTPAMGKKGILKCTTFMDFACVNPHSKRCSALRLTNGRLYSLEQVLPAVSVMGLSGLETSQARGPISVPLFQC